VTSFRTIAVFCLVLIAFAPDAVAGESDLRPLEGVPLSLSCNAELEPSHPLLDDHPGRDLYVFSEGEVRTPSTYLSDWLCARVWKVLEDAGAHRPPANIKLPATATLSINLIEATVSSERVSQEFFGREVSFVPVPHWSVELFWSVAFGIVAADGSSSQQIETGTSGKAELGDYMPLELDTLLQGAMERAFGMLPDTLVNEGGLGNLFFARVERPTQAPEELEAQGTLSEVFWLLMTPDMETRHAAMAILLSAERISISGRTALARWFVLNDPDLVIRQDALSWLLAPLAEEGRQIEDDEAELVAFVLQHDRSYKMRKWAIEVVGRLGGAQVRELLLMGSLDGDLRVSDLANSKLRRLPALRIDEVDEILQRLNPRPALPVWTQALDGRVSSGPEAEHALIQLAEVPGSEAGARWLVLWLQGRPSPSPDAAWVLDAWARLAVHPEEAVRAAALSRFGQSMDLLRVEAIVVERIYNEPLSSLRIRAIRLLDRPDAPGAIGGLLEASKDSVADVRRVAARAMSILSDPESGDRLVQLRADEDPKVRREAKKSLRKRKRAARKGRQPVP